MKQLGRAVCPYCGKKVNLILAWGLRRKGEYRCPRCNGISNVFLTGTVLVSACLAVVLSILLLLGVIFWSPEASGWDVLLVLSPYVLFYGISLFGVQLKKPVLRRAEGSEKMPQNPQKEDGQKLEDTRELS